SPPSFSFALAIIDCLGPFFALIFWLVNYLFAELKAFGRYKEEVLYLIPLRTQNLSAKGAPHRRWTCTQECGRRSRRQVFLLP
ncbi:MAG: hypothetical protein K0S74_1809, partial [Chlamydiales bacterium]|nr:hypothetical protein [Chlamydiales bacterium]